MPDVICATCNKRGKRAPENFELPEGFYLECERCHKGTPTNPRKTVRHCSMCQEPIIVMAIPGDVRLLCRTCAGKDVSLVAVEAIAKERSKLLVKVNELEEQKSKAAVELDRYKQEFQTQLHHRTQEVLDRNQALQAELEQKKEDTLADRIRMKMQTKHWQTQDETLREFLVWFQVACTDVDIGDVLERYHTREG